jgi:hypothetical protein
MVKFNETLLLGISLLAALVLSKGSSILPRTRSISFIDPYTSQLSEAQAQAIQKGESNIETLQSIKESNLGIAQDILDYERNIANTKIDYLQTELSKTQAFISQEQKYTPTDLFGLKKYGTTGKQLLSKFDSEFAFYQTAWTGEKGPLSQKSLFPDIYVPFSQSTRAKFAQQARYEEAQERISEANQLIFRQQTEIDRLEEEYQTRFGGLSRYG